MAQSDQKYDGPDDNIIEIFSNNELDELQSVFNKTQFKMSWNHITNCIKHEMYPKLANTINSIINNQNQEIRIGLHDIDKHSCNKLLQYLKTQRKLGFEEREYLSNLFKRARSYASKHKGIFVHLIRFCLMHEFNFLHLLQTMLKEILMNQIKEILTRKHEN